MPSDPHPPALQAIETWRAGGATFDWNGQDIWYRDEGGADRPVLVMIHGFPTASWDWRHILPAFTADYRVIMMDLLGFGLSAKPRRFPYSILAQADMVEALLAELGVARCPTTTATPSPRSFWPATASAPTGNSPACGSTKWCCSTAACSRKPTCRCACRNC